VRDCVVSAGFNLGEAGTVLDALSSIAVIIGAAFVVIQLGRKLAC
jgi:hypothetical protein